MKTILAGTAWTVWFFSSYPGYKDLPSEFPTRDLCRTAVIKHMNARAPEERAEWSCNEIQKYKNVPATAEELERK